MGAFFLAEKGAAVNERSVLSLFSERGFPPPFRFDLGTHTLLLYRKQLVDVDNSCIRRNGSGVFAVGTPIYRGLPYRAGLERMAADVDKGCFDSAELSGQYCIISRRQDGIELVLDGLACYHVFADESGKVVSSSFLAILMGSTRKRRLNRMALLENLSINYVIGPDTPVEGIIRLTGSLVDRGRLGSLSVHPRRPLLAAPPRRRASFDDAVRDQVDALRAEFGNFRHLVEENGLELALSGGYDSRLLLSLCLEFNGNISAHTHGGDVRTDPDCTVSPRVAQAAGIPLELYQVTGPEQMDESLLRRNLHDAMLYLDGKTYVGWTRSVRTRAFALALLGSKRFIMNGLGGELFRNWNCHPHGRADARQWLKYVVLEPQSVQCFTSDEALEQFSDRLLRKLGASLGTPTEAGIDRVLAKRHFAEVFCPDMNGALMSAQNQLSFALMPFSTARIVSRGYDSIPYQGASEAFEAAMIKLVNPSLAEIPTNRGFPPARVPIPHALSQVLRVALPYRLKNVGYGLKLRLARDQEAPGLANKHSLIREILDLLGAVDIPFDCRRALRYTRPREKVISVGYFLLSHRTLIDIG